MPNYIDTGLTNGTTYYYVITSLDKGSDGLAAGTESANSSQVSATPDLQPLIPVMTSNTTPSGIASASSAASTFGAYRAFNNVLTYPDAWIAGSSSLPQWVQYQFTTGKIAKRYAIYHASDIPNESNPACSWTLLGSNDGSSWTTLDTQTNVDIWAAQPYIFNFSNTISYTYYRWNLDHCFVSTLDHTPTTTANGNFAEIQLYG